MKITNQKKPTIIGFREWVSLSELQLPAIKAKIDTGAKTSSLHAYDIKLIKKNEKDFVQFKVHPMQKDDSFIVDCEALLIDQRTVTDSGGHKESRFVIQTTIQMGKLKKKIELTLTNRIGMKYRMLIGREALRQFYIDPSQSYLLGKSLKQKEYLKQFKLGAEIDL
jgi:hypothetical protein